MKQSGKVGLVQHRAWCVVRCRFEVGIAPLEALLTVLFRFNARLPPFGRNVISRIDKLRRDDRVVGFFDPHRSSVAAQHDFGHIFRISRAANRLIALGGKFAF